MSIAAGWTTEARERQERLIRLMTQRATPLPVRLARVCMAHDARRRPCRIRPEAPKPGETEQRLCVVHRKYLERRARER